MEHFPENEIHSARELNAPVSRVYEAFSDPDHLANWWGPEGFTNTIHEFDLRPGGNWRLTMHGPEVGHYENASVFEIVDPMRLIRWKRTTQPHFDMEIHFRAIDTNTTEIAFRMIFKTAAECAKIKNFAGPKNEENFDRLERELAKML